MDDTKVVELITKLHTLVTAQQEALAHQREHIKALQTAQYIIFGLLFEYDSGMRLFMANALHSALQSDTVADNELLRVHFRELLKLVEAPMPPSDQVRNR